MDISVTNFSQYGSYMSLGLEEGAKGKGFYLKSLHGVSKAQMQSLYLCPSIHGRAVQPACVLADCASVHITFGDCVLRIAFLEQNKLLLEGQGEGCGLDIDTMPVYNFEYSYLLGTPKNPYCLVNSYKNLTRYLVYTECGALHLEQAVHVDAKGSTLKAENHSVIRVQSGKEGRFRVLIQDIPTHNAIPGKGRHDFVAAYEQSKQRFAQYAQKFPPLAASYQASFEAAVYVLWSSTVSAQGNLKYPSVYASINHFPGVWSWDHCFVALALAPGHSGLAFEQMASIFAYQDAQGQIPGSISDSTIRWNFCKPPIHGYVFEKMLKCCTYNRSQLRQIYTWIEQQTLFYLQYKDSNRDGICEYCHGNDSGHDNSTVFLEQVPVDSPDLTAYLIKNMEFLCGLSKRLGYTQESVRYEMQAEQMMQRFLEYFVVDGLPTPKKAFTGEVIHTDSILPLQSLILGKRLPKTLRENMIKRIKEEFLTPWGVATEACASPYYSDDAYWRGPIWAPETWLLVEALRDCGEMEFSHLLAERFCNMVHQYGFAENFNAQTGEGLRDRSFSWTAAVFLWLGHQLMEP